MIDLQELIIFIITLTAVLIFIRKLFFRNKKEITIEVKDCSSCPFKEKKEGMLHYNCKFNHVLEKSNLHYRDLDEMKKDCKIEGKLNITLTEKN